MASGWMQTSLQEAGAIKHKEGAHNDGQLGDNREDDHNNNTKGLSILQILALKTTQQGLFLDRPQAA